MSEGAACVVKPVNRDATAPPPPRRPRLAGPPGPRP